MGKGICKRKRLANAEKANMGNLLKLMKGKAGAKRSTVKLPDAPKEEDWNEKPVRKLRILMKMKEGIEKKEEGGAEESADAPNKKQRGNKFKALATGAAGSIIPGPLPPAGTDTAAPAEGGEPSQEGDKRKGKKDVFDRGTLSDINKPEEKKGIKQKKKDFLKKRDNKKKGKVAVEESIGTTLDQSYAMRQKVMFGETSDRPPNAALKSKHWAPAQKEKTAADRCKDIFMKQMNEAQNRQRVQVGAGVPGGGLLQKAKKEMNDNEKATIRLQMIQAYRDSKRDRPSEGNANLSTLSRLVKKK